MKKSIHVFLFLNGWTRRANASQPFIQPIDPTVRSVPSLWTPPSTCCFPNPPSIFHTTFGRRVVFSQSAVIPYACRHASPVHFPKPPSPCIKFIPRALTFGPGHAAKFNMVVRSGPTDPMVTANQSCSMNNKGARTIKQAIIQRKSHIRRRSNLQIDGPKFITQIPSVWLSTSPDSISTVQIDPDQRRSFTAGVYP